MLEKRVFIWFVTCFSDCRHQVLACLEQIWCLALAKLTGQDRISSRSWRRSLRPEGFHFGLRIPDQQ